MVNQKNFINAAFRLRYFLTLWTVAEVIMISKPGWSIIINIDIATPDDIKIISKPPIKKVKPGNSKTISHPKSTIGFQQNTLNNRSSSQYNEYKRKISISKKSLFYSVPSYLSNFWQIMAWVTKL